MKFKLLSYEAVQNTPAEDVLSTTQRDLQLLLPQLGLSPAGMDEVKLMDGEQGGIHKMFVLIPLEDETVENNLKRLSGQVWNPELQRLKLVDVILERRG